MYCCDNCGKPITNITGECPYCHQSVDNNNQTHSSEYKQPNMYNNNYKRNNSTSTLGSIIAVIVTLIGIYFTAKAFLGTVDLEKDFFGLFKDSGISSSYEYKSTPSSSSYDINKNYESTKPSGILNTKTSHKNYQEIYDEYSKKLIDAGPTSSISEMAEICNEGVTKMAEYMYLASGTDGQYETYESWADKLFDVYMENCR
ncbi:MAG: hypothetical protein IKG14_00190 [Clostridia bacterium]|nr:hypothetical protein [Clostridia bacterium]